MSEPFLVFGEAAYLTMLARRTLNYRREAEQRNEEYHDMTPFIRLACGARVRLRFTEGLGNYQPVVDIKVKDATEAQQIADEVTGKPMVLSRCKDETYTFTRKTL